jgi:hypothetical protein
LSPGHGQSSAVGKQLSGCSGRVAAAWSRGLKIHSATIDPTPEFRGHTLHANPLRGIRFKLSLARLRDRAESAIVVYLAGPEAQQRHSPRSWRAHHGASDFKQAFDLATGLNTSEEAVHAYLDWLTVVARDEIVALWPQVEKVAHALVARRTLTAGEVKSLLASQQPPCSTNVGRLYPAPCRQLTSPTTSLPR